MTGSSFGYFEVTLAGITLKDQKGEAKTNIYARALRKYPKTEYAQDAPFCSTLYMRAFSSLPCRKPILPTYCNRTIASVPCLWTHHSSFGKFKVLLNQIYIAFRLNFFKEKALPGHAYQLFQVLLSGDVDSHRRPRRVVDPRVQLGRPM